MSNPNYPEGVREVDIDRMSVGGSIKEKCSSCNRKYFFVCLDCGECSNCHDESCR